MSFDGDPMPITTAQTGDDVIVATDVKKHYVLYRAPSQRFLHLLMPWRTYPRFEALKGVSLHVRRGETVGIIGNNGAGKSTLLQIITGTVTPSSGEVLSRGRVAALLELGAGFEPDFTGRENIVMNATILGLTAAEIAARMDDIIAFSELAEFIDRPVRTYSSGMFMRLAFSVAAHVDAEVLIIDEALAVGDARFVQKCMRFLKAFKQRGSILFVSHDLSSVMGLCDRAIWLDQGTVRGEGPAGRVCEDYMAAMHDRPLELPNVRQDLAAPTVRGDSVLLYEGPPGGWRAAGVTGISPFNPEASSFGQGGAKLIEAGLYDPATDRRLDRVEEGQEIDLKIVALAEVAVEQPIFGFIVKDRLGQQTLGDNSYRDDVAQVPLRPGEATAIRFRFRWPAMSCGAYTLTVALADGSQERHIQRHWLHDAVIFEVLSSSATLAMIGVPITLVAIDRGVTPPPT